MYYANLWYQRIFHIIHPWRITGGCQFRIITLFNHLHVLHSLSAHLTKTSEKCCSFQMYIQITVLQSTKTVWIYATMFFDFYKDVQGIWREHQSCVLIGVIWSRGESTLGRESSKSGAVSSQSLWLFWKTAEHKDPLFHAFDCFNCILWVC